MTESYLQIAANNEELARDIVERASALGVTVSTAESLTAGMIASTIADIPGASAVLRGGAVTYCDEIKHRVLGVEQDTLDRFSAVSHQTAREMAAGGVFTTDADACIAVTGIAGPDGGTEEKPVGLVYIACYMKDKVKVEEYHFRGNREKVREQTVIQALDLLRRSIIKNYKKD